MGFFCFAIKQNLITPIARERSRVRGDREALMGQTPQTGRRALKNRQRRAEDWSRDAV